MVQLPIQSVLPALKLKLQEAPNAVLVAAPGAGKTTQVPLALLHEPWLEDRQIIMLEPRRLAARSAAAYMASLLGEQVGQTVGYRVRHDTRVSTKTRIEVVTEGVLTRMLQEDPALEHVGLLIFDEFHERNLHADVGLALALESQAVLRDDLRILVMSATLDAELIAELLQQAPIVRSEGHMYPIVTHHAALRMEGKMEPAVAAAIMQAMQQDEGDALVFLPGAGEIRRTAALLDERLKGTGMQVRIAPLYGSLSQEEQDAAIAPSTTGERKVVLATSIAETSLTVEGVRIVIDSGWMRVPRFSPRTGMMRLETIRVSRASADQRRGRAGRVAPGVCYRLWTAEEDRHLAARTAPEMLEADLASLVLELAAWGAEPDALRWLDAPPAPAVAQARELLRQLGALDARGAVTAHGRSLAALPLHPRLAHMLRHAEP
ncbi:ATP-dependent helicase HrpB, partial [Paenibacillus selenitireducens]